MTSPSDIADLLRPGAIVPVDAETTRKLLDALRGNGAYKSQKHYSQAFPKTVTAQAGMTLRDYFAAKAMQSYWSDPTVAGDLNTAAAWAYDMADAMLEARDGKP